MKLLIALLFFACTVHAQQEQQSKQPQLPEITAKWKMNGNKYWTGGLILVAGAAKGFNETLQFHWKAFHAKFPKANPQWYNPAISWRNKYKDGDPNKGAKFLFSTNMLVMTTDQYHLNNFFNRMAIAAAIVIKIGEKKKRLGYYVKDLLYYSACYQAGWSLTYLPFKWKDE